MKTSRPLLRPLTLALASSTVLAVGVASAAPSVNLPNINKKTKVSPKRPQPRIKKKGPQLSKSAQFALKSRTLQSVLRKSDADHDVFSYVTRAYGQDLCAVTVDDVTYQGETGKILAWTPGRLKLENKSDGAGKRQVSFMCTNTGGACELWFYDQDGNRQNPTLGNIAFKGLSAFDAARAVNTFNDMRAMCPSVIQEFRSPKSSPKTPEEEYVSLLNTIRRKLKRRDEFIFPTYNATSCQVRRQSTLGFITSTFDFSDVTVSAGSEGDAVFFQCPGDSTCIDGDGPHEDANFILMELTGNHGESISQKIQQLRQKHPTCN
jgi:hypothetical protein